jgi:hypothetical protein
MDFQIPDEARSHLAERDAFAEKLSAAIRRHLGEPGEIRALSRLTGGATKATWSFDAVVGSHVLPLVLQQSSLVTLGAAPGAQLLVSGARDAVLMQAAVRAGVPAPRVRLVLAPGDGIGEGYVTERVDGETLGRKINTEARFDAVRPRLAAQCGGILAAIHRIDARGLTSRRADGRGAAAGYWRSLTPSSIRSRARSALGHGEPTAGFARRSSTETSQWESHRRRGRVRCVLDWSSRKGIPCWISAGSV